MAFVFGHMPVKFLFRLLSRMVRHSSFRRVGGILGSTGKFSDSPS